MIEDDARLAEMLRVYLGVDVVVLDLMLPHRRAAQRVARRGASSVLSEVCGLVELSSVKQRVLVSQCTPKQSPVHRQAVPRSCDHAGPVLGLSFSVQMALQRLAQNLADLLSLSNGQQLGPTEQVFVEQVLTFRRGMSGDYLKEDAVQNGRDKLRTGYHWPHRRDHERDSIVAGNPGAAADLHPAPGEGPKTVLVVDDDRAVGELLERFLVKEGFRVVTATSGEEGLRTARDLRPALITLDVVMRELDGWAVLRTLKSDPDLAAIPVIMVTIVDEPTQANAWAPTISC